MSILRWILMIPAAIAAWYLVFALGMFTYTFVDSYSCPSRDVVSGLCTHATTRRLLDITMHAFVAASAVAVMSTTVVIAPGYKKAVAALSLAVGTLVAASIAAAADMWTLFGAAAVGGCTSLVVIVHLLRRPATDEALRVTGAPSAT